MAWLISISKAVHKLVLTTKYAYHGGFTVDGLQADQTIEIGEDMIVELKKESGNTQK